MSIDDKHHPDPHTAHPGPDHEPLPEGEEAAPPWVHAMALVRWTLIALMAVAAVGTWAHFFNIFPRAGANVAQQYHCPMHPSVIMDHPGECPICGMDLVPITRGSHEQGAASQPASAPAVPKGLVPVMLSAERIGLIGMQTAKVGRAQGAPGLRTVGFVAPNEKGLAQIQTRFAGWIETLAVAQTGQRVSRGQVLATVYSPDLLNAQQDFLNIINWATAQATTGTAASPRSTAQLAPQLVADARRKLELLGISREEIDEVQRTGKPIHALKIRATAGGYVTQKNALRGLYVQPGTQLFEVADLATVWVIADLYEYEVTRVTIGQPARFALAAYPGQVFEGRVQFIYPTLSEGSRTLRVRVELKNPGLKLRPGMYGNVQLDLGATNALVVPREAVVDTGEATYVFVLHQGGNFEPRLIRVGAPLESKVQVVSGLADGETVVTTGNFAIDAESRLRAAIQGASGTGTAKDGAAPAGGHQH
ncbi:MAG TPA: efflux RND transporter periplasmic adaptor subunit [Polyangia bacterium]|jgi:Cu(I)/Ag(I) efflux system membrane fusion protein